MVRCSRKRVRRRSSRVVAHAASSAQGARRTLATLPKMWIAKEDVRRAIKKKMHPWLYDDALKGAPSSKAGPGDVIAVAWKKETLAYGFYAPESVIRLRLLSFDMRVVPDRAWVKTVVTAAANYRLQHDHLMECTGLRLLNGECDWTPGLVIDAYAGVGVVRFDGPACEAFWTQHLKTVAEAYVDAGFELNTLVQRKKGEGNSGAKVVWGGKLPDGPVTMLEHGAKFEVDVVNGHKTGFFLDQRENRRILKGLSRDKDVLDLFSYTGGFAVSAALGRAKSVTAVDQASLAMQAAKRNFALNGFEAVLAKHQSKSEPAVEDGAQSDSEPAVEEYAQSDGSRYRVVVGDCWEFLEDAVERGELYDIVVCDPPSMAPNAKSRKRALNAYEKLNVSSLKAVRPGGLLISCSCSSHVTKSDLRDVVERAGKRTGREINIDSETRAAVDHPVRRGFGEGDYLQALYIHVMT